MVEPGIYTHYKGKRYEVLGVGRHSETLEEFVVYRALYEGEFPEGSIWLRPKAMFEEDVELAGERVPRFTKEND